MCTFFVGIFIEEVFSSDHTLWWSPDSQKILFGSFDDSDVGTYSFPKYGDPDQLYDTIETIRYPKVSHCQVEVLQDER